MLRILRMRRIVDCRDEYDKPVADSIALEKYLVKVNPVEAMLDDNYFWRKLLATQGDPVDVGSSLIGVQKQLADVEEETAEGGRGSCRGRVRMWEVFDMCVFGR
eukprot:g2784.t1